MFRTQTSPLSNRRNTPLPHWLVVLAVLTVSLVGCSSGSDPVPIVAPGPDDGADTGVDAGDTDDGGLTCDQGEESCDGECVETATDPDHCGSCHNGCSSDEICEDGTCSLDCEAGQQICDEQCVDTSRDDEHCGMCTNSCGADRYCSDGSCRTGYDCEDPVLWPPKWRDHADEVVNLVNQIRLDGTECTGTAMDPVDPVTVNSALEQAARCHSLDMSENEFQSDQGSDGDTPEDRAGDAGYTGGSVIQNIASGYSSPEEVVDSWLDSELYCEPLMDPDIDEVGVGFAANDEKRWTFKAGSQ